MDMQAAVTEKMCYLLDEARIRHDVHTDRRIIMGPIYKVYCEIHAYGGSINAYRPTIWGSPIIKRIPYADPGCFDKILDFVKVARQRRNIRIMLKVASILIYTAAIISYFTNKVALWIWLTS